MAIENALLAFGVTVLAELGDKTQLVLVTLALRGRRLALFAGAAAAFLVLTAVAVAAGGLVGRLVPDFWVALLGGALFVGFGLYALHAGIVGEREEASAATAAQRTSGHGAMFTAFGLVAAAEMGDKTQIALAALAANTGDPIAVGVGGTLALVLLGGLALLLGGLLARYVPQRIVHITSGILFLIIGVTLVVLGVREAQGLLAILME